MKRATKINIALLALTLSASGLYAQQGFGTATPNKASVIDMKSNTKGLLIPRVALTSTTVFAPIAGADSNTANSLLVYNTNKTGDVTEGFYYWTSADSKWNRLVASNDGALSLVGDVNGALGSNTITKIQNQPVTFTGATSGQVITWNGSAWVPADITAANVKGGKNIVVNDGLSLTGGAASLLTEATIGINDGGIKPVKIERAQGTLPLTAPQVMVTQTNGTVAWVPQSSLVPATTNILASNSNTLTSTVNGVSSVAPIVNTVANTVSGSSLTTTVNGVPGTIDLASAIQAGQKTTTLSNGTNTIVSPTVTGNVTDYKVNVATATNTGNLGVVKQAATTPTVNIASDGALSVNTNNVTLNGDVTGPLNNTKVVKIQNVPVSPTAPTANQVLQYIGSSWTPTVLPNYISAVEVTAPITNTGTPTVPSIGITRRSIIAGNSVSGASAPLTLDGGAINAVVGGADATLTVNNTAPLWNANQLQGKDVTGTPSNGQVLQYNGTSWAPNALPNNVSSVVVTAPISNTGTATAPNIGITRNSIDTGISAVGASAPLTVNGGANAVVGGTNATLTVNNLSPLWNANQLQGRGVANTTPSNGQVLQYNGSNWTPVSLPGPAVTTANNGLEVNGTTIQLGGNLTKATTITNNGNAFTIATGGTPISITGLPTVATSATDRVIIADANGVLKQAKSVMPSFFYMPAIVIPTHNTSTGSVLTSTQTIELYTLYSQQFNISGSGTTGTGWARSNASSTLPTLPANQLDYFITYYDTDVYQNVAVSATGQLTYTVKSTAVVTPKTFMNIVFKVRD